MSGPPQGMGGFFSLRAQHKAEAEEGRRGEGRKEDGERGDDSPLPSGLSGIRKERTHNTHG